MATDRETPDPWDEPWAWVGTWQWQHFALIVLAVAMFVALSFAPMCSLRITTSDTPTTTVAR
jgi:hypothetical protein